MGTMNNKAIAHCNTFDAEPILGRPGRALPLTGNRTSPGVEGMSLQGLITSRYTKIVFDFANLSWDRP